MMRLGSTVGKRASRTGWKSERRCEESGEAGSRCVAVLAKCDEGWFWVGSVWARRTCVSGERERGMNTSAVSCRTHESRFYILRYTASRPDPSVPRSYLKTPIVGVGR